MKRYALCLAMALLMLVAGCKRGAQNAPGVPDTPSAPIDTVGTTVVADTVPPDNPCATDAPKGATATLQQDSAEITNLRFLTRKQKVIYSPALLVGEWVRGTEHEVYLADGTGRMWDTSEDIARSEAQSFNWTLDSNLLTIVCHLELGGILPKRYVVTFADDENLAYRDLHGTAYLWDKR